MEVRVEGADVIAVLEIPRGSRNKYEYDEESGAIFLERMLFTATRYPADYGYILDTAAEDGDPLDVLVPVGDSTFPEHFFAVYKELEGTKTAVLGWRDEQEAQRIIENARAEYGRRSPP